MYEQIKDRPIRLLSETVLNEWISEEVIDLANDFGQTLADDLLKHICERLRGAMLTKYRSWAVGDIHAALQVGMSGAYGPVHKITVQRIFMWLKSAEKQRVLHTVVTSESNRKEPELLPEISSTDYGAFVLWCTHNKIWLDELAPGADLNRNNIEPLRRYASEFATAKKSGKLYEFRYKLMNQRAYATT
ncbi:MAG: hypothetical protein OEY01_11245 [Desulfobulbaceae bacterium]|nr:hypothetical protein [Desulfobulbaceae bacterium]